MPARDKENIALLYHLNLNHFSVPPKLRHSFADEYLPEMLEAVETPITITLCAEDLLYLSLFYPETYRSLIEHPSITFLLSTFAHVISTLNFGNYVNQVRVGKDVLEDLIPAHKLSNIGYPSEAEMPPAGAELEISYEWQGGIILCETMFNSANKPDHFIWQVDSNQKLPVATSRRDIQYRPAFHSFLREQKSEQDVYEALIADASKLAGHFGYLARIDIEGPLFNVIQYPDGSNSGPRMDLWKKLHRYYSLNERSFLFVRDIYSKLDEQRMETFAISPDTRRMDNKWKHHSLSTLIEELEPDPETFRWILWLSTHTSDYFCSETEDITFDLGGRGKIYIPRNDQFRRPELIAKLLHLGGNSVVNNAKNAEYIDRIIKTSQAAYSLLRTR